MEANVHLIYVDREDIEKLTDAIAEAGLEIENLYLNAYASLKSTLIDEESTKMGWLWWTLEKGQPILLFQKS